MAEVVNAGRWMVIVKDWERVLNTYKAELMRISLDGEVEVFLVDKWHNITECKT